MACLDVPIQTILGTECIGDSLPKIMGNFNTLGDATCDLITKVNTLSTSGGSIVTSLSATIDAKFVALSAAVDQDIASLSATVDNKFALNTTITGLSSTVDAKFIPKPASASAQQVLTYNASTTTWVASAAQTGSTGPTSAKAWVNFNGTTSPGTIRSQYNVSSVTKNGTGDYTINFSTPMADANYSISACGEGTSSTNVGNVSKRSSVAFTTSAARILCGDNGTSAAVPRDASVVCFQVFGN